MAKRSGKEESGGTGFLSRWSERKRGGEPEPETPGTEVAGVPDAEAAGADSWSEEDVQAKLAEIEEMKQGDDFKPLLKAGVPELVKRAALRKLWRSNPVFGILDGLNDYDLDYTLKPSTVEQLRSAYQAGKGYVYDEEKEAERQAEIAARRERDKQREKERQCEEKEKTANSGASDANEEDDRGGETAAESSDSAPAAAEAKGGADSAPKKPHGSAAARRWGGDPA